MDNQTPNRWERLIPSLIFLFAFGFALAGLNPTFYVNDSPETVTACLTLGIPHPPGYPFHTLLGHFFSALPLAHLPFRINLFSAVLAASVCLFLFFLLKGPIGVSTRFAALFSLFWITGATAYPAALSAKTGIYHLTALFLVVILWALLEGRLGLAAFLLGLSFTNHWMSMVAFSPGFAYLAYTHWKEKGVERPRLLVLPAFFILGLSVYLFLPIRAQLNPMLNWGNPSTWHQFVFNFLREQYSGPEGVGGPGAWFPQWWEYLKTAFLEFWGLFLLALFGAFKMFSRLRSKAIGLVLVWLCLVVLTGLYLNLPKDKFYLIGDYTLAAHVFILLFAAWGLEEFLSFGDWGRWKKAVILILVLFLVGSYSRERQTDYTTTYDYVLNAFKDLPRKALYFCRGDGIVFPSWYFQWVEGKRTDLAVIGVDGLPMEWVRKNLALFHKDLKVPFSPKPLGTESIPALSQWIVSHNQDRELYFSYNKIDDGSLPGFKPVPYGMSVKVFPPGQEPHLDGGLADFCWNGMRLRHLRDPRFSLDSRTQETIVKDYAVFRNNLGIFYEDRADDAHAKLTPHSKAEDLLGIGRDYQKSYEQFNWAREWDPANPQYDFNTGNALFHVGRAQESLSWYEKAVNLDKNYTIAYFNWAVAALQLGQNQKAGELFEKVLELKPDYSEAKRGLDYLIRQGLYHKPQKKDD